MLSFTLLIISVLGLALFILGLSVYLRNRKNGLNKLFFSFAGWVSTWMVINYIAAEPNVPIVVSLWANRLVLVVGGIALLYLLAFLLGLARWGAGARWFRYLTLVSVISWAFCLTPLIVKDLYVEGGVVGIHFGGLSALYFIPLFLAAMSIGTVLFLAHARLKGLIKTQIDTISLSILISVPIVVIGNAVLPIFGYYALVNYTPLSLGYVVIMMAYVIAKHKLFNIRPFIVRSITYIFSIGIMSAVYAFGIHSISDWVAGLHNSFATGTANVLLVVVLVTAFQPLKKLFDRTTNKIFYKDAYDPQSLLGELNKLHISVLNLDVLARNSIEILEKYLKVQYCVISLNVGGQIRSYSVGQEIPDEKSLLEVYGGEAMNMESSVLAVDELNERSKLVRQLEDANIAALLRLRPDTKRRSRMGYIVMGPRKSGVAFTDIDLRVFDSIINELSLAIQNSLRFEEIERFNATLQQRVDDATRKLRRTNEKLRQIDETKDEFISMASHQLRTPLTSMKGYVSMVLEGDVGEINEGQKKMLSQAFVSSQRMASLISDLLNVSRLRTGKFVIERSRVDLADVVQSEVDQLSDTAKARGLELRYDKPDDFPFLMLDETKTRQVIMNFIDNAIYYTPMGGVISVNLKSKEKTIEFTVTDNGIGVPKAEQPHLFTKFYRAGNARKARPDGTGLGLFMAKKVIVAQGGAIIFKTVEGHGSVFGFTFSRDNLKAE